MAGPLRAPGVLKSDSIKSTFSQGFQKKVIKQFLRNRDFTGNVDGQATQYRISSAAFRLAELKRYKNSNAS